MRYDTSRFGPVEILDNEIIHFPKGLYGFEQEKKFALMPFDPNIESPMEWLQSLMTPELAFAVTDPFLFVPNYKPVLTMEEKNQLEIQGNTAISHRVIVTIPEVFTEMTANLIAPLVINTDKMQAKQIVLTSIEYDTCQLLLPESARVPQARASN